MDDWTNTYLSPGCEQTIAPGMGHMVVLPVGTPFAQVPNGEAEPAPERSACLPCDLGPPAFRELLERGKQESSSRLREAPHPAP